MRACVYITGRHAGRPGETGFSRYDMMWPWIWTVRICGNCGGLQTDEERFLSERPRPGADFKEWDLWAFVHGRKTVIWKVVDPPSTTILIIIIVFVIMAINLVIAFICVWNSVTSQILLKHNIPTTRKKKLLWDFLPPSRKFGQLASFTQALLCATQVQPINSRSP